MKLDIRRLAKGFWTSEYDDPELVDTILNEEVDIREIRRRCRYSHHSRPANHCRNRSITPGAPHIILKPDHLKYSSGRLLSRKYRSLMFS